MPRLGNSEPIWLVFTLTVAFNVPDMPMGGLVARRLIFSASDLRNGLGVSYRLALLIVGWRMRPGGLVGIVPAYARFIFAKIYQKTPKDTAVFVVEAPSVDSLVWALALRVAAPGEDW